MDINFISIFAILLTFESAYFFAYSGLSLSPTIIAEVCKTKYGLNLSIARPLCDQYGFSKVGLFLLISSIVMQFLSLSLGISTIPFVLGNIFFAIVLSIIVFIISFKIAKYISKSTFKKTELLINNGKASNISN
jgi:hypothetical protein